MKILHILPDSSPGVALGVMAMQAGKHQVGVLLVQEGLHVDASKFPRGVDVFALAEGEAPKGTKRVTCGEVVDLLFSYERVLKW